MKRIALINLHLGVASLFLPFMLLMPITGGLHLLGVKGEQVKTTAFKIEEPLPEDPKEQEAFFRDQFKKQGIEFDFEYVRAGGGNYTFRPSSRVHYMATKSDAGIEVFKLEPDLAKRLMEIHMGHGPGLIKMMQIAFAFALVLVSLTGVWLAVVLPAYRQVMLMSFGVGAAIVLLALFI